MSEQNKASPAALTDAQRRAAAKAMVEVFLGFPAPDREPGDLDLRAVDAVVSTLAAQPAAPADLLEAQHNGAKVGEQVGYARGYADGVKADRQGVALSERDTFESAYAAMLNAKTIAQRWGLSPYTPADIASMRQGNSYQGGHTVLIAGWELWQAAHASFSRPDIEGYKTLLGYVCDAKQAMRERGIPLAQFKDMFPKLLEAFDRASSSQGVALSDEAIILAWVNKMGLGGLNEDQLATMESFCAFARALLAAQPVADASVATQVDTAPMYKALMESRLALLAANSGAALKAIALIDAVLNAKPASSSRAEVEQKG